ncbi:MAG: 2-dehydropantoate 2-reductase [Spirochaetales bacterium]|jgi:2-dehydropantoate 2-reductase|nr:2-dehydropantoate 2-reductase [Spirochaetales bacterium]
MNIVIIGAGALGSLFGARLAQAQAHVVLFDRNAVRATALHNRVTLREKGQDQTLTLSISSKPTVLQQADLILLCTKSGDVQHGLELIRHNAPAQAIILGFQNGIAHINAIKTLNYGCFGVTAQGATLLQPGHVQHGGNGPTIIGHLSDKDIDLQPIATLLSKANIPTTVTQEIERELWQKLLINIGINGLTVIYNCENGRLLDTPQAKTRLIRLVEEGVTVAKARHIAINTDPVQRCLDVCTATAINISSMLQDFRKQKPSEIMAINGALVQEAEKLGIATPENKLLIQQVLNLWPSQ